MFLQTGTSHLSLLVKRLLLQASLCLSVDMAEYVNKEIR